MLFYKRKHFPKQLFVRFLIQQIFGLIPILLLASISARAYLSYKLGNTTDVTNALQEFDKILLLLGILQIVIITGISLWTGYRLVLPLGRILVKARSILKKEYSQAAKEEEETEVEDGEWSDLETTLSRIGKNMESQDLSLSQEREQIEAIISGISEAVVAIDQMGNILFYNSQFALLFGDQTKTKKLLRISDFFRNPDILEAFRGTLKSGAPSSKNLRLHMKGEPMSRFFSLSLAPLKPSNGSVYGAVGVFHDVTELKHMDQVRIDFVANVSHELRTPLTSIKGYAQTLKEDVTNIHHIKFLETIERNTDRLIALVQDLLNLSSLESGTELEEKEIDLHSLTERVLSQLENQREEKKHKISTRIEAHSLRADPKRIEQVLLNLVENAIKYVPTGGNIEVRWEKEEKDIRLVVADDGPGIPLEHHNRIFERFYRLDSARAREQGGTGLGLSIVKHIVQRHGGKVLIQSGLKRGSEFICIFPIERK